ncbi:MAG: hypothetical protein CL612_04505 [Anaerolineaceae bacterium]|nr:hypothetical protein [Anaerolineaceae bacterium]
MDEINPLLNSKKFSAAHGRERKRFAILTRLLAQITGEIRHIVARICRRLDDARRLERNQRNREHAQRSCQDHPSHHWIEAFGPQCAGVVLGLALC